MFAFGFGPQEITILLIIVVVLFGAKKLPELGRSLGQGIKEFKHASKNLLDDDDDEKKPEAASKTEKTA